jgi:hypothetical protein
MSNICFTAHCCNEPHHTAVCTVYTLLFEPVLLCSVTMSTLHDTPLNVSTLLLFAVLCVLWCYAGRSEAE